MKKLSLVRYGGPDINSRITECVEKYGWGPEHNADYFFQSAQKESENAFFITPEGWGALAQLYRGEWWLFTEPLAPASLRPRIIRELCTIALAQPGVKKVVCETTSATRRELLKILSPTFRSASIAETFVWPILNLEVYDPSYPGHAYKSLRNIQNRFSRDHTIEIKDTHEVSKDHMHALVERWKKARSATHRGAVESYHGAIDHCFRGMYGSHLLIVDGVGEAINAGWRIPQSNAYYLATSLHSYAHWGLGEFSIMKTLEWLKEERFLSVDLGGSDKNLLAFKRQFGQITTHKTHQFSIYKK